MATTATMAPTDPLLNPKTNWREQGLCQQTDPEAFYPEKGGSSAAAKRICNRCPVKDDCLEDALRRDEKFGVWGGLSEADRRRLKRRTA